MVKLPKGTEISGAGVLHRPSEHHFKGDKGKAMLESLKALQRHIEAEKEKTKRG